MSAHAMQIFDRFISGYGDVPNSASPQQIGVTKMHLVDTGRNTSLSLRGERDAGSSPLAGINHVILRPNLNLTLTPKVLVRLWQVISR